MVTACIDGSINDCDEYVFTDGTGNLPVEFDLETGGIFEQEIRPDLNRKIRLQILVIKEFLGSVKSNAQAFQYI